MEAQESTRKCLERTLAKDHEDHVAGKVYNSISHFNLVHKFIPMRQAMKITDVKAAVDKEWKKRETILSKQEVIPEAQRDKKKVHCATLMDICHLKTAELEPKFQNYKGRVVKDVSGAYAVFTEQGKSASQMTAAKVMDVIARRPDCDGQAADAVSAYTEVKMEDAPKLLRIPKITVSRRVDTSSTTQVAKIMVKHQRSRGVSWKNLVWTPTCLSRVVKDSLRRFQWALDGKNCRIGDVCLFIGNKDYAYRYLWIT